MRNSIIKLFKQNYNIDYTYTNAHFLNTYMKCHSTNVTQDLLPRRVNGLRDTTKTTLPPTIRP